MDDRADDAATDGRSRAQRMLDELAARGEGRSRGLQKGVGEAVGRSRRNGEELARLVTKEIRRRARDLGLLSGDGSEDPAIAEVPERSDP